MNLGLWGVQLQGGVASGCRAVVCRTELGILTVEIIKSQERSLKPKACVQKLSLAVNPQPKSSNLTSTRMAGSRAESGSTSQAARCCTNAHPVGIQG